MELRDYLAVLARRKHLVLGVLLATVASVVGVTLLQPPAYTATATVRVEPASALVGGTVRPDDIAYLDRLVNTYARTASSRDFVDRVVRDLKLAERPKIDVAGVPTTNLLEVSATTGEARTAAEIANGVASRLIAQVADLAEGESRAAEESFERRTAQLENEIAQGEAELAALQANGGTPTTRERLLSERIRGQRESLAAHRANYEEFQASRQGRASAVSLIGPATAPNGPSNRRLAIALAVGLLLGAIVGPALAFAAENLSRRFRTGDEIEASTQSQVLAAIPLLSGGSNGSRMKNGAQAEEAFRRLRTSLLLIPEESIRTILVTSAEPGEGKSTVVTNLARSLAESGRSVVAVDADLRSPTLHANFGLQVRPGLSDVLLARSDAESGRSVIAVDPDLKASARHVTDSHAPHAGLNDMLLNGSLEGSPNMMVVPTEIPGLSILPAGSVVDDPATLLGSRRTSWLLDVLARRFDYVVVDSPALLAVPDALVMTRSVDGVLLVAGSHVQRDALRLAHQELSRVGVPPIGVVVNGADDPGLYPYLDYPSRQEESTGYVR